MINTTYNTQSTEYCKADMSKYISFSINISLNEISRSIYKYIFESCLSCSFLVWAQNFSTIQWIVNFNSISYSCKDCLRITSL